MKKIYLGVFLSVSVFLWVVGAHASGLSHWGIPGFLAPVMAQGETKRDLPPLIIDDDEPLLLLEEPEAEEKSPAEIKALTESQPCFVCHVNYQEEPLAVGHVKAGFSCVTCHGESFAHRNDENNTTPPDRMVPAESIEKLCKECHMTHDAPAIKVIALWQKRCAHKTDPKTIVCTDCHGQHRLKVRTVQWNKKTGQLLPVKPSQLETP